MYDIKELAGKIDAKSVEISAIFEAKSTSDFTSDDVEKVRQLNAELADLKSQHDAAKEVAQIKSDAEAIRNMIANTPAGGHPMPRGEQGFKSFGEFLVNSPEYKAALKSNGNQKFAASVELPVNLKTMLTSAGIAPEAGPRNSAIVASAQRPLTLADIIPTRPTNFSLVSWLEETTFTNNAAPVAENGLKPESDLKTTERTAYLRVIAHTLGLTEQQFEDVPGIMDYVNGRMVYMLMLAEENEILNGNGTDPHLAGILTRTGLQTATKGTDTLIDAVVKAAGKVRTGAKVRASHIVLNPSDWDSIKLEKDSAGNYLYGNPANAFNPYIAGYAVLESEAVAAGSALIGDFSGSAEMYRKGGVRVAMTNSDGDDFSYNRVKVRVEERVALAVLRPAAFVSLNFLA